MILYHNTSNENAIKIATEGIICGLRAKVYGKGSEAEGAGIWCTIQRGYGYGGATITFEIDDNDESLRQQNDTEYIVYRDVTPSEIIDIDLVISSISSVSGHTGTLESDIPTVIEKFGKDKTLQVFKKNEHKFVTPYDYDLLVNLIETGNKVLKGTISLTESKKLEEDLQDAYRLLRAFVREEVPEYKDISNIEMITTKKGEDALRFDFKGNRYIVLWYPKKDHRLAYYKNNEGIRYANNIVDILDGNLTESKKLEEASRNELLAKSKAETITRYNKSSGYKGFSLVDIDTTAIKTRDVIIITNRVGDYFDTVELDDILYWVGLEVDEARDKKMTLETVRRALLGAMDGMNIKVDCNCGDFVYRFAYMASVLEYKYGKPENRPSNITNPNGYGAMCKHLISLLSNKSWVKQVATTLQQWIVDEIDWVRDFLKVTEEDFQLPDEYARQLGKHGAMKKFWGKTPDSEEDIDEQEDDTEETNEDGDTDNKNNEATNDTPEESNLNNQTNMPKAFRDNKSDEELEEK